MSKKKLNKTVWYGSDVDLQGNAILPPLAEGREDLNGIHEGEIYLHNQDDDPGIWVRTNKGNVKRIGFNKKDLDLSEYLKKQVWDTAWELRTTEEGESYIFCKLPFISQYGITLYADGGNIDLPSLYAGIPVDETTITKREDGTLMLNPNLELGGLDEEALQKYLDDYNYAKLSDIPSLDGYAKLTDVDSRISDLVNGAPQAYDTLKEIADVLQGNVNSIGDIITTLGTKADKNELAKYIPIAGDTEVTGIKNFLNGLKVGGLPISKYEGHDDVIYIDANVVLRGGLTQYAVDPVTIPSIIESLPQAGYESKGIASFSSEYFVIDANGKVSIIPDSVGLNEEALEAWLASSDYTTKTYVDDTFATKASLNATNAEVAKKWTQDNTKIANWDAAYSWGNHASAGYFLASNFTKANIVAKLGISDWALSATKPTYKTSEVTEDTNLYFTNQRAINALAKTLEAYVTLKGTQTIEGEKDFTGGLKVNGSPIVYDSENGYWLLQGNLLITGGLTQYVDDGSVDLPNLYDGLPIDNQTIYWEETANGKVLKAQGGSGGITSITKDMVEEALGFTPYDATNPNGYITSAALNGYATQTWVNQQGFLTSHQSLDGYVNEITTTGTGNAVTSISKNGNKLTFTKGATYLTSTVANGLYHPLITESTKLAASLVSGLATVATSGSYNDLSNKPTIPTNTNQLTNGAGFITSSALSGYLPLSGGTLTSEGNTPLTLKSQLSETWIAYHDKNGFLGSVGVTSSKTLYYYYDGSSKQIWHSGNFTPSNYLPLSGGILSTSERAVLNLKSSDSYGAILGFQKSDETLISNIGHIPNSATSAHGAFWTNNEANIGFVLGSDGVAYVTTNSNSLSPKYKIWHSGNDGSGSGLDADLLDGYHVTSFMLRGTDNNTDDMLGCRIIRIAGTSSPVTPNTTSYGAILQWSSIDSHLPSDTTTSANWYYQIIGQTNTNNPYFRKRTNGGAWSSPKCLAFTTDNVASATKLQTARKIWGQDFDGTGNVSGDLNNVGSIYFKANASYDIGGSGVQARYIYATYFGAGKNTPFQVGANDSFHMYISTSGNVGIGTTSPSYKLHISHSVGDMIKMSSTGSNYACIIYEPNGGSTWSVGSNSSNQFYFYHGGATRGYWDASGNLLATGGLTQHSDIRKKTKLNDVELTLKQVANAPLIEHYYNSDDKKTTHVGSIAQYWAGMNDWFCKLDSDGYYTMEIQNAALASAISVARELERYESKTDKKIRMLKKRINELEDEIEKLKNIA